MEENEDKVYKNTESENWRFCAVGNIKEKHQDEAGQILYGTIAFTGGTKVYINDATKNLNEGEITVLALNRFKKYAVEKVPIDLIENIRLQRVYKPKVLEIMENLEAMDGFIWRKRTADERRIIESFIRDFK